MTTRGQVNSNFYQIVNVDANGNPTSVKSEFINDANTANYANYAGNVTVANQPNITTVGTLVNVNVSGQVHATGNVIAPFFIGNVVGNVSGNFVVPGSNTDIIFNNNGNAGASDNLQFDSSTNILTVVGNITTTNANLGNLAQANYFSGSGNLLSNIQVGNITGLGNIATINLDGSSSNVLYGNGVWAPGGGANANYANYAGNVVNASQGNITSLGTLTSLNVTGNITVGNATLGNLASASYFSGDGGLLSNIVGGNVSGQVANALVAGTVYTNAQPNITSLGTLSSVTITGLTTATGGVKTGNIQDSTGTNTISVGYTYPADAGITGNLTVGTGGSGNLTVATNSNLGNLATANFFSGDGGLLSNITAANVVGNLPVRFDVKNTSGGTLTKGTPVYITGSVGISGTVEVAASRADTAGTMGCVGLLEQTLAINATGTAISVGSLTGMNTNSYTIGQELYVAPTGGITNVRPTGANIVQPIGIVARVNSSTGIIETNIWDIVQLPNLDNGNIWVGTTGNGAPVQAVLATANVGNANYASYAGNVTVAAQGNITSLGTLTSLTVSGNVTVGNISSTGLGNVANVLFTKYNETVVAGGNANGTITPNVASGTIFNYTLTGNITLSSLTNAVAGSGCTIILTQDGTGNRLLTSTMKFLGASKTLSTAANSIDIMSVFYDGTTYYASLGKGYA